MDSTFHVPGTLVLTMARATTEADEAIALFDFLKIMGISPRKGANRGDSGQFWSLSLVWF